MFLQHQGVALVGWPRVVVGDGHAAVGDELAGGDVFDGGDQANATGHCPALVLLANPVGIPRFLFDLEVAGGGVGRHPVHDDGDIVAPSQGRGAGPAMDAIVASGVSLGFDEAGGEGFGRGWQAEQADAVDLFEGIAVLKQEADHRVLAREFAEAGG